MSGERGSLVALSFDDGPDPLYTGRIARTLADHGVQATFFLIGRSVSAFPEVVREVAAMGHEIGAHSQTHPVMTKLSPSALATEMRACSAALASVVPDARVRWFRPPYGECNSAVVAAAAARGLDTVRWDIDPRDWSPKQSADAIANDIVTGLHPGAVALMHSINARSEAAVPAILRRGQEAGYQFVTVSRWWDAATKAAASHPA